MALYLLCYSCKTKSGRKKAVRIAGSHYRKVQTRNALYVADVGKNSSVRMAGKNEATEREECLEITR